VTAPHAAPLDTRAFRHAVDEAIHGRRSVRTYRPDPIPDDDLAAILDAARWAPSPHNAEPWRFVVLRGAEAKNRLAAAMGQRWASDLAHDGAAPDVIDRELRESHRRITGAPVVVIVSLTSEGLDAYPDPIRQQAELLMAAHSVGSAVQNIMLAAYARGIATGWMCAPLFCPDVVVEALGLPPGFTPQGLITMGYPVSWPNLRKRRAMNDLVIDVS
jgi:F420 biosynthesis protein FbiB-like protein